MEDAEFGVDCRFLDNDFVCFMNDRYVDGYFVTAAYPDTFVLYDHEEGLMESNLDKLDQGCEVYFLKDSSSEDANCEAMAERFPSCDYPAFCYEDTGWTDTGWNYQEDTGLDSYYQDYAVDYSGDYTDMGL
jgi:hypothetical protein